jgi:competence protein ComEC
VRLGLAISSGVACAVAGGVLAPVGGADAASVAIATASIAVAMSAGRGRRCLVVAAIFSAAAADGAFARDRALGSPLAAWLDDHAPEGRLDEPVRVVGTIAEDASVSSEDVRVLIDVDRIEYEGRPYVLRGRLQAGVAGSISRPRAAEWTAGRSIDAPVALRMLDVWRDPGSPNERWQRLHRAFDVSGSIKSGALVTVRAGPWWREVEAAVRACVRDASVRFVKPRDPQSAAIVTAILIGDRAGLDASVQRRLQAAGTYHVIAISGGNVALLTALCFVLTRVVVRAARAPAIVTIVVVLGYSAILGDDPSIQRAVAAATLFFALSLAGLVPDAVDLLAVVAMVIAIVDPLVTMDVGAWLSFGATFGIIVGARRIAAHLRPAWANDVRGLRALAARTLTAAAALVAATLSAEIALLPIGAGVFSRVSVAGLALNFVAIPAMSIVEVAGFVMVGCARWWPAGAAVSAVIVDVASRAIVRSTRLLEVMPWLSWRVPPVGIGWAALYYAACAGALWMARPRHRAFATFVGVVTAIVISSAPFTSGGPPTGEARLTMLDVGQGDGLVLQAPNGQTLLVDSGGLGAAFDIGGRIVTPALWALGVRRLDWLLFTHPDADHIGGALSVATDLRPREIWEGVPVPKNAERAQFEAAARSRGVAWRQLLAGDRLVLGAVVIDVLHPPRPDWERQKSRNDDSVVLRVQFGDVAIILTGDAGAEFESQFVPDPPLPPLRLLKVGHHGSRSSSSARFIDTLRPQAALISVGRSNLFGHPAPDVLARLNAHGTRIFRTDRDGAISVTTDGRTVRIETWTGVTWTLESQAVERSKGREVAAR